MARAVRFPKSVSARAALDRIVPRCREMPDERSSGPMSVRDGAQALGTGFRGDVALGHAEQLESDHEFAHRSRAQQGRKEVRMEVPFGMLFAVRGSLVKAHGVGK